MQGITKIPYKINPVIKPTSWPTPIQWGTIVNDNFSSLSAWGQTGSGTFTPSVSGLTVSGGSGSVLTDFITFDSLPNSLENWTITVSAQMLSGGSFIYGINSLQINASLNRSFFHQVGLTSGNTLYDSRVVTFNDGTGTTATAKNTSSTSAVSTNDIFTLTFNRVFDVYTATVNNITKGTQQVATWTVDKTTVAVPNVSGKFVIFAGSGSWKISNITVVSPCYKNVRALFVGDSITQLVGATTKANRYSDKTFANAPANIRFEVNAGGNHRVNTIYQQINTLKMFNPKYFFMMIGGNNVLDGQVFSDFQTEYTAIRDAMKSIGSTIIHYTPTPRTPTNESAFRDALIATFTSDIILDSYTWLKGSGTSLASAYDSGDGVHPGDVGYDLISRLTLGNLPQLFT